MADNSAATLMQFTDFTLPLTFKSEVLPLLTLAPEGYWAHQATAGNQLPPTTNNCFNLTSTVSTTMSSFASSPQRSKSTSAEQNVDVHGQQSMSKLPANCSNAVNSTNNVNSSSTDMTKRKRITFTGRRKQQEQQQELAEEPPDDYTRTVVEKMRSLMQATQPKLPITKVIELVGIPTNKFYEYRKRYLPGVYRTASSKKHRMNSEEEQVAVKKIRALIQESPHATMQEIIKRVGLPTTKFYDLRRRFLSHMFDGSNSKRKTPNNNGSTSTANESSNSRKSKPALVKQEPAANFDDADDADQEEDESHQSSGSSERAGQSAAAASATFSTSNLISTSANTFTYNTNSAADNIAAASLIMSHLQQPTTSSSFISCLQPQPTLNTTGTANFVTNFNGYEMPVGGIKIEPFVGALTLPPHMQIPTSINSAAAIPFMNADQFGNLTAMHTMPTSIDFSQHQQQLQQQQFVSMHPYWAYTTSTMLPEK